MTHAITLVLILSAAYTSIQLFPDDILFPRQPKRWRFNKKKKKNLPPKRINHCTFLLLFWLARIVLVQDVPDLFDERNNIFPVGILNFKQLNANNKLSGFRYQYIEIHNENTSITFFAGWNLKTISLYYHRTFLRRSYLRNVGKHSNMVVWTFQKSLNLYCQKIRWACTMNHPVYV